VGNPAEETYPDRDALIQPAFRRFRQSLFCPFLVTRRIHASPHTQFLDPGGAPVSDPAQSRRQLATRVRWATFALRSVFVPVVPIPRPHTPAPGLGGSRRCPLKITPTSRPRPRAKSSCRASVQTDQHSTKKRP